jgi:hypothetical protein
MTENVKNDWKCQKMTENVENVDLIVKSILNSTVSLMTEVGSI